MKTIIFLCISFAIAIGGDYQIGIESSMKKIFLDETFKGEIKDNVEISLAKNEYESFQLVIIPNGKDLKGVKVSITDLTKEDGSAKISKENLKINVVGYVNVKKGAPYYVERIGWYPDVLLPNMSFDVTQNEVQPIWITVYAPKTALPGKYTGEVNIHVSNSTPSVVKLSVGVYDFELPKKCSLKTMCWVSRSSINSFYATVLEDLGLEVIDIMKNYYTVLLEHKLGPGGEIAAGTGGGIPSWPVKGNLGDLNFSLMDELLQFAIDRGMNSFVMAYAPNLARGGGKEYSEEFKNKFAKYLKEVSKHLEEKKWLDMAYVYVFDEAPRNFWPEVKKISRVIKGVNPKLKVFQCLNEPAGVKELSGYVDVWDIYVSQYNASGVIEEQQKGKELWLAVCVYPFDRPNVFIEYSVIDVRILPWLCWHYKASGFEYWCANSWANNAYSEEIWSKIKTPWKPNTFSNYNGEGYLLYPGPKGTALSSIRLVALRDGFEDHDYFTILSEKIKEAKKRGVPFATIDESEKLLSLEGVITSKGGYTEKPEDITKLRSKIALQIEKISKLVK